jgi:hypothetical protein
MASLTFDVQKVENTPSKSNKKVNKKLLADVGSISVDETMRFISKIFIEKNKKDQITRKNQTPNFSIDELTV